MSDRTPSEKIWADLESQLAAMDHEQLVRICAHLIRTYVVEDHRAAPARPAQQERTAPTQSSAASPFGGPTPPPEPPADPPPQSTSRKKDSGYNKLEME